MAITVQFVFDEISKGIAADPSVVGKVGGVFHFKVGGKSWTVDLKNGSGNVKQGAPEKADCTVTAEEADFIDMMLGKKTGQKLFMEGKVKIQGNMGLAMKLEKIPKVSSTPSSGSSTTSASSGTSGGSDFRATAVFEELGKRIASNPQLVQQIGEFINLIFLLVESLNHGL